MFHARTYILILLCALATYAGATTSVYRTKVLDPTIRTLRVIYQQDMGEERQLRTERPILVLQDGRVDGTDPENTLHISFDQMSHEPHMYTYTLLHLDADWTQSRLVSSEYVEGFTTADITEYMTSLNTTREYTHYSFTFPNDDMQLTRSGNYAIQIYEDGDINKTVAWVCFSVAEPRVKIDAQVRSNTDIELSGRYQQVDIDLDTRALDLRDPGEIRVLVRQNGRIDNQVMLNKPTYVEPHRLRYTQQRALIYEGGNEYHHLDAYSTYYAGHGINRIVFGNNDYHVQLFADEVLGNSLYIHEPDANGQFVVNAERTNDADTEAEYMWVHWQLPCEQPWLDAAVYVGGEAWHNQLGLDNRMQYDAENKCYWLDALLKQGGYDYQFWCVGKGTNGRVTTERIDGSHWQTNNEYTIYIYWRPFGERADRLVGVRKVLSA